MFLITGANGQLGTELRLLLDDKAIYLAHHELDISDELAVKSFFNRQKCIQDIDIVINCAAYTAVDRAEDEPEKAEAVNHFGARYLARYGKTIVHISTDYVFDGTANIPYAEDMSINPLSVYGASKQRGEQAVLEEAETALVIRTSWLYALVGNNFLNIMLRLGASRKKLNVIFDQIGTPTSVSDLARAIVMILPQIKKKCHKQKEIYHFSNEGVCSWYDFAVEIMKQAKLPCHISPILGSEYPAKAHRPVYSVLDKTKIKRDFTLEIAHWRDALIKVMNKITR